MPKRSAVGLHEIAEHSNLMRAFARAAKGKRRRPEVVAFAENLDAELNTLSQQIRTLTVSVGHFRSFQIFDPKPRRIHAPCFRERVLHHALMAQMGPVLERGLVADTFACRPAKGTLAAVLRAQQHARRFPVFVKVDIRRYFDSISHQVLLSILARRFKNPGLLALCRRIIDAYCTAPSRGLPIGALTSQHFAQVYLSGLDRYLLEQRQVDAMVRYMDDFAWWHHSLSEAKSTLHSVQTYLADKLQLALHPRMYIQRSVRGLNFLGFRIFPHALRLSRRRRQRYLRARHAAERAYRFGLIDAADLQRRYESALATIAHADSFGFRADDLQRHPAVDA